MLRALPMTILRVVLLPRKAGTLPLAVDVFDQVLAQLRVELRGALLVRAGRLGNVLRVLLEHCVFYSAINLPIESSGSCS